MENDLNTDYCKSPGAIFEIRKDIVRMHKKDMDVMKIAETKGICWQTVHTAIDRYGANGISGLRMARRGRPSESQRALTPNQERQIQKDICEKQPEQLKMDFALWTREAVMKCFREHFGVGLSVRTVGDILRCWGCIPQKPIRIACEREPGAVKAWLGGTHPAAFLDDVVSGQPGQAPLDGHRRGV